MRSSQDFASVTRLGRRTRSGGLVAYLSTGSCAGGIRSGSESSADRPALVGLIVGKSVGGSVNRHRVSRRLRAELSRRVSRLPAGSGLVIRALPELADVGSADIGRQLDRALAKLLPTAAGRADD